MSRAEPIEPVSSRQRLLAIQGPLLVAAAAVFWSTSAFFAGSPLFNSWPVEVRGGSIAFWRAVFALTLLLPLVRKPAWHWVMIPMTLFFTAMNWTYLTALVGGPPANAIWLQNLAPAWVMLVAILLFKESVSWNDWLMLGFCISGVLFILLMEIRHAEPNPHHRWWAPWLAIASGVLYAGVILCLRWLREFDSAWLIALNHIVTAAVMCPIALGSVALWPTKPMWFFLIGIGVIQMGLPYLLFAKGLRSTPSHIASLITLLEPVLLPVWVHLARSGQSDYKPSSWWTWVGGACIVLGLAIRYLPALFRGSEPTEEEQEAVAAPSLEQLDN